MHQQFHVSLTHSTHFGQVTTCVSLADHCSTWSLSLLLFHSLRSRIRFIPMLVIAVLATLCWDCCLHTGMDILSAPIDRRAPFVGESTSCQFYSTSLCSSRSLFYSSLPFRISSLDCTKYSVLNRFTLMEMNLRSSCLIQEARLLETCTTISPLTVTDQLGGIVSLIRRIWVNMEPVTPSFSGIDVISYSVRLCASAFGTTTSEPGIPAQMSKPDRSGSSGHYLDHCDVQDQLKLIRENFPCVSRDCLDP